jgi:hypothetical protein
MIWLSLIFLLIRIVGGGVQLSPLGTSTTEWPIYLPRVIMIMENLVEWRFAGETEVLGENLPQRHFVHHKSHLTRPGLQPRTAEVGSQRLTAWDMARPDFPWRKKIVQRKCNSGKVGYVIKQCSKWEGTVKRTILISLIAAVELMPIIMYIVGIFSCYKVRMPVTTE